MGEMDKINIRISGLNSIINQLLKGIGEAKTEILDLEDRTNKVISELDSRIRSLQILYSSLDTKILILQGNIADKKRVD